MVRLGVGELVVVHAVKNPGAVPLLIPLEHAVDAAAVVDVHRFSQAGGRPVQLYRLRHGGAGGDVPGGNTHLGHSHQLIFCFKIFHAHRRLLQAQVLGQSVGDVFPVVCRHRIISFVSYKGAGVSVPPAPLCCVWWFIRRSPAGARFGYAGWCGCGRSPGRSCT